MEASNHKFKKEQDEWCQQRLSMMRGLRPVFEKKHQWLATHKSLHAANDSLRRVSQELRNGGVAFTEAGVIFDFGLSFDADDQEIKEFAEINSRKCESVLAREKFPALVIQGLLERCCIDAAFMKSKRIKKTGGIKKNGWPARVCDMTWWLRAMRKVCNRKAEQICRNQGFVSRRTGVYVSDFSYRRWLSAQRRNRLVLDGLEATNDQGEKFVLSDLHDVGVSNPQIRRDELMTRMRGFEEWAEADSAEWVPFFYTITCPSKYHIYSGVHRNDKYSGVSPREAQDYLCGVWAKIRAKAAREKIDYFGFRVAEPHHDGCPHWHLLLFVERRQSGDLSGLIEKYAKESDEFEPGAAEHRFKAVEIRPEDGTPAGYIAKYVAKNIDGFGVGEDYEAQDYAENTAARVRAWASIWGIRQFQQIGGPPVTVWRELRRAANNAEQLPAPGDMSDQLVLNLIAADGGDWSAYTQHMGGAVKPRRERPIKIEYIEKDKRTFKPIVGRYGDPVKRILGLVGIDFLVVTRVRSWVIDRKERAAIALGEITRGIRGLMPDRVINVTRRQRIKPGVPKGKWVLSEYGADPPRAWKFGPHRWLLYELGIWQKPLLWGE